MPDKLTDKEIVNEYKMFTPAECLQKIVDQNKEINRLQAENKEWKTLVEVGELQYRKQKAEIEDLEKKLKKQIQSKRLVRKQAKSEAYKECIEKVKEIVVDSVYLDELDDLLKEMVGEE